MFLRRKQIPAGSIQVLPLHKVLFSKGFKDKGLQHDGNCHELCHVQNENLPGPQARDKF